jgi:hypothetical protein
VAYDPDPSWWARAGFGWLVVEAGYVAPARLQAMRQWLRMALGEPAEAEEVLVWRLGEGPPQPLAPPAAP